MLRPPAALYADCASTGSGDLVRPSAYRLGPLRLAPELPSTSSAPTGCASSQDYPTCAPYRLSFPTVPYLSRWSLHPTAHAALTVGHALDRRSSRLAAPRQATSSSIRRQHGTGRMGTGSATAPRMLTAAHSRVRPGFGSGRPEAAAPLSPAVNAVARRQSGAPRAHRRLSHRFRRAARALGLVIPIVLCVPAHNSNSQLSGSGQVVCCLQLYTIRAIQVCGDARARLQQEISPLRAASYACHRVGR